MSDSGAGLIIVWVKMDGGFHPTECQSAGEVLQAIQQSYGSEYRITRGLDYDFLRHMDEFFARGVIAKASA